MKKILFVGRFEGKNGEVKKEIVSRLHSEGYETQNAVTAKEALTKIAENGFTVVITELGLSPGIDGFRLKQEIKTLYPGIKVVAIKRTDDSCFANFDLKLSPASLLFNIEELIRRIMKLLGEQ